MILLITFPISCLCPLQIILHSIIFLIQLQSHYSPFKYLQWLPITYFIKYKLLTWLSRVHNLPFQFYFPPLLYVSPAVVKLDFLRFLEHVTTYYCLSAFVHAIPFVLSSQFAETLFNFQSSLKVQFLNLIKLCNSLTALRFLPFIVVIRVLISLPFSTP